MHRVVIVVGLKSQGLAICRLMGRAGWKVYSLCPDLDAGRPEYLHCKYIRHRVSVFSTDEEFFDVLGKIRQAEQHNSIRIIITSAVWLAALRERHPELWTEYDVWSGPIEALNMLADKSLMYEHCRSLGLPTVHDVILPQYKTGCLQFPVVIKHNIESVYIDEKCIKCCNEKELNQQLLRLPIAIQSYMILQEYIGSDFKGLDFRGFIQHGKVVGYSVVESIREKPIGVSSYLVEVSDPIVLDTIYGMVKVLLAGTDYTGFIGMDLKYRPTDGKCYILDVNPRTPSSISAWLDKYDDKDLLAFFKEETPSKELRPKRERIRWVNLSRDFQARKKENDWKGVWKSLTATWDIWDKHDPWPFILWLPYIVIRKFKLS